MCRFMFASRMAHEGLGGCIWFYDGPPPFSNQVLVIEVDHAAHSKRQPEPRLRVCRGVNKPGAFRSLGRSYGFAFLGSERPVARALSSLTWLLESSRYASFFVNLLRVVD